MTNTVKCLVEVEFTGPNAADGPQILVDKSNEMSSQHGGIPMSGEANCFAKTFKLVKLNEPKVNWLFGIIMFLFGAAFVRTISILLM